VPPLVRVLFHLTWVRYTNLSCWVGLTNISGLDLNSAIAALHTVEHVQITYGAIILSFLGALHWGMEFAKHGGEIGIQRLAIGVVPVLIAWPTTFLAHGIALGKSS
jgi:hypothetical protein